MVRNYTHHRSARCDPHRVSRRIWTSITSRGTFPDSPADAIDERHFSRILRPMPLSCRYAGTRSHTGGVRYRQSPRLPCHLRQSNVPTVVHLQGELRARIDMQQLHLSPELKHSKYPQGRWLRRCCSCSLRFDCLRRATIVETS
jgi:hypothetical protein